jgi:hypothetical protein
MRDHLVLAQKAQEAEDPADPYGDVPQDKPSERVPGNDGVAKKK